MASSPHLITLPPEVLNHVLSLLPQKYLLRMRLVNHHLNSLATPGAFRSIRLVAFGDSPDKFMAMANSKLRIHVRDVTVDTWLGPGFEYRWFNNWELPDSFVDCFPFLSCFRGIDSLHIRFHEDCAEIDGEADEYNYDRVEILFKIFQSLAGNWFEERERRAKAGEDLSNYNWYKDDEMLPPTVSEPPIQLSSLTICNLGDRHEPELTSSKAFKLVMGPALRDLRLRITTETIGEDRHINTTSTCKFISFENLHTTWLSLDIVTNLHTLSLYCHEPWGFTPKMDFRRVGEGRGLPNLRVLALGCYTFSHEWQIDWFGSLNLEELYLHDCAVLHQYERGPSEMDHSEMVIGQDDNGKDIVISNQGYYKSLSEQRYLDEDYAIVPTAVRWHMILSRWRETMTSLRVFKMSTAHWADQKIFRAFDRVKSRRPEPPYARAGLTQDRQKLPLYLFFLHEWAVWVEWDKEHQALKEHVQMMGQEWDLDDERFGWWELEDGLLARDEAALDLFMSTVEARRGTVG